MFKIVSKKGPLKNIQKLCTKMIRKISPLAIPEFRKDQLIDNTKRV